MNEAEHSYYDCLIFIGRFQPFHAGHLAAIRAGLERAGLMIVICGSARQPRSIRNPWNDREREEMLRGSLTAADNNRIHIVPLPDDLYDDQSWLRNLEQTVNAQVRSLSGMTTPTPRIGLIMNDGGNLVYTNLIPRWERVTVPVTGNINSTTIRNRIFATTDATAALTWLRGPQARAEMPAHVIRTLEAFCATTAYIGLKAEYDFLMQYRKAWSTAPYPPVFVTVDAVAAHGRQILLIERKHYPGKGLWALPGGFVNQDETLVDACVRELQEETRINLSAPDLKNAIAARQAFDYPYRSALSRIITHAFYFVFEANSALPKVSGGDDASHAQWLPLSELDPARLHDDHYFIIRRMLAEKARC